MLIDTRVIIIVIINDNDDTDNNNNNNKRSSISKRGKPVSKNKCRPFYLINSSDFTLRIFKGIRTGRPGASGGLGATGGPGAKVKSLN